MISEKKTWFPAKKYGWGWSFPNTWQGWVVFVLWLIGILCGPVLILRSNLGFVYAIMFMQFMVILLFAICLILQRDIVLEPRF